MSSEFDSLFASCYWPSAKTTFGEAINYIPLNSEPVSITGLLSWNSSTESAVAGRWPSLELLAADLTFTPEKGDQIQIGEDFYSAWAIHFGTDGSVRIEFNKVQ